MICKNAGIPKRKYMSHSTEEFFGKRYKQKSINYRQGGTMGSRAEAVKQWKKSENKWNRDLKALKKQNKNIYIIYKNTGSRR